MNGTDVYPKDTHTGQYTHFSSFEHFSRKATWVKSLFHRAHKIGSTKKLFDNQIKMLKSFMSLNGYPKGMIKFMVGKLKRKYG